jgi:hypothetical protein
MMFRFDRYVPLSLSRLWVRELAYFASKVPTAGGTALLKVKAVATARRDQQPPIGWGAIMVKAIALVARRHPELKRCYMPWPWAHFYEHPHCVATIMVERQWRGERAVFADQIHAPEQKSLREIDAMLRGLKQAPVESVGGFRRLIRHTHLPPPLRRLMWRIVLYGSGRLRSRYVGTFAVSSVPAYRSGFPTQAATLPAISIFYGSPQANGDLPVQIFFDHRVTDGVAISRLLFELFVILRSEIIVELGGAAPSVETFIAELGTER